MDRGWESEQFWTKMAIFGGFSEKWVFFQTFFFSNFASGGQATADMDLKPILNINLSYWNALNPIWDL